MPPQSADLPFQTPQIQFRLGEYAPSPSQSFDFYKLLTSGPP
jgi:hypothetical protein